MRDDFDMLSVRCDMRNDIVVYLGLSFFGIHPSVCLQFQALEIAFAFTLGFLDFWDL